MGIPEINKKKTKEKVQEAVVIIAAEVEKTPSELFLSKLKDLNPQEQKCFDKIKEVRLNTCLLEEYEAFALDTLDDYVSIITHMKHGKLRFDADGVIMKVRTPILTDKGKEINEIKILFERNASREQLFTKKMKVSAEDINSGLEYSLAIQAAAIANAQVDGNSVMISKKNVRSLHSKDKAILSTVFEFFRK